MFKIYGGLMNFSVEELLEKDLEWFNSRSAEELEEFIELLEAAVDHDHINQLALKILINSLYGALANKHFLLANPDMAAAITSSGRFFIQLAASNVERELQKLLPSEKPYVIYGDTDSAVSTTILRINSEEITIGELFDSTDSPITVTPSGAEVKRVEGKYSLTYTPEGGVQYQPVEYVMRHKVQKRMYRITSGDKSVEVTCDHSLKVMRNGELIDVKPSELQKGDKIVRVQI